MLGTRVHGKENNLRLAWQWKVEWIVNGGVGLDACMESACCFSAFSPSMPCGNCKVTAPRNRYYTRSSQPVG
jgi:hypothetical protein